MIVNMLHCRHVLYPILCSYFLLSVSYCKYHMYSMACPHYNSQYGNFYIVGQVPINNVFYGQSFIK